MLNRVRAAVAARIAFAYGVCSIRLIETSGQLHVVAVALPIFLSIRFEQFIIEDKSAIAVLLF